MIPSMLYLPNSVLGGIGEIIGVYVAATTCQTRGDRFAYKFLLSLVLLVLLKVPSFFLFDTSSHTKLAPYEGSRLAYKSSVLSQSTSSSTFPSIPILTQHS